MDAIEVKVKADRERAAVGSSIPLTITKLLRLQKMQLLPPFLGLFV